MASTKLRRTWSREQIAEQDSVDTEIIEPSSRRFERPDTSDYLRTIKTKGQPVRSKSGGKGEHRDLPESSDTLRSKLSISRPSDLGSTIGSSAGPLQC